MPRLTQTATIETPSGSVRASPTLDMLNAMYFTSLVPQMEGVDGWPAQLRREMAPDLLAELDALYEYPAGDPGVMGIFGDNLFAHPSSGAISIRLIPTSLDAARRIGDRSGTRHPGPDLPDDLPLSGGRRPRRIRRPPTARSCGAPVRSLDDRDAHSIMAVYDHPAELRERMADLIERFYTEHYRHGDGQRLPALERSAARRIARRRNADPDQLATKLTGKQNRAWRRGCAGPVRAAVFTPSLDMGPVQLLRDRRRYPRPFLPTGAGIPRDGAVEAEETSLARVYKALGDEQRLRILRMLRDREMYAQEIVERTGLHQSVVSRHLQFMRAVGLLQSRKQNNMKFFSLNPAARDMLSGTLALFDAAAPSLKEAP